MVNAKICRLRYVILISGFIKNIMESSSNETKILQSNQDTLTKLEEI